MMGSNSAAGLVVVALAFALGKGKFCARPLRQHLGTLSCKKTLFPPLSP